jgi:hypothetical protein
MRDFSKRLITNKEKNLFGAYRRISYKRFYVKYKVFYGRHLMS